MNIKDKKNKFIIFSTTAIGLLLVILIAINYIGTRKFIRYDVTQDQRFSISSATKNIVRGLDDRLTIKVFFSSKLPPNLKLVAQQVRDMLEEFQAYGKNNIVFRFIDPADNDDIKKEVKAIGIPEVQMNVYEKDKMQVINGYLGIALLFGGKKEVLPVVQGTNNLEYDLASAILRLKSDKQKKIGFLIGHREHGIGQFVGLGTMDEKIKDDYKELRKALEKNYEVTSVNIAINPSNAFKDIDTLIVAGPQKDLSKRDKFEIDQYIMNGGKVIFLLDKININEGLSANLINNNTDDLLANLGLTMNPSLLLDTSSDNAVFSRGFMQFVVPYPLWVMAINDGLSRVNPITAQLESLVFPWTSGLEFKEKEGIKAEALVKTTANSWEMKSPFELNPQQEWKNKETDNKERVIAYFVQGNFESMFKDIKSIPPLQKKNDKGEWEAIKSAKNSKKRDIIKKTEQETQIIAIANSRFIDDESAKRWPQNLTFFQNAVDYLTLGQDLISVRSKAITNRPFKETSVAKKQFIKALGIFLAPILLLLYGGMRYLRRKKNNERIRQLYK